MKDRKYLLFILNTFTVLLACLAWYFGYFHYLWEIDVSKLSFAILSVFSITTLLVMFTDLDQRVVFLIGTTLVSMGLMATVIGLSITFSIFYGLVSDVTPDTLKAALPVLAIGVGTKFQATLCGLITSILLNLQMATLGKFDK